MFAPKKKKKKKKKRAKNPLLPAKVGLAQYKKPTTNQLN